MKNKKLKIFIVLLSVLASIVSVYAWLMPRFPGDLYLTHWLQSYDNHSLMVVMQWVSGMFTSWPSVLLIVIISALVWWRIGRLEAIVIPVGGLLTVFSALLKPVIGRPRPSADIVRILSTEHDKGFPSGHAFLAIVILGLVAYFIFITLKNNPLRTVTLVGLTMLILLVGTSRVYLGVHWSSDVIGGYLIGGVFLSALIWFYRYWKGRYTNNRD